MTMITKRLAAVAAGAVPAMGIFGPKRAGGRHASSKHARLEQSGPSFADPTRNADLSTMLRTWTFILASVGFVVQAVLVVWVISGTGEPGLSGKGHVALTLAFLFTADSLLASWRSSSSAAAAVATTRPLARPSV
jgi:hypothetical protein